MQINGQKKAVISANKDTNQQEADELVKNDPKISKTLAEQKITKIIFIRNKLINFVI